MRQGERLDNIDPLWASTATRPWDPPLAQAGRIRAFQMGRGIQQMPSLPSMIISKLILVETILLTIQKSRYLLSMDYVCCEFD
ncbi:hypothetical protein P8452_27053 [Trifolium repens]|nr:hypothetical protein P8452_27053 [Trifolium repens]